MKFISIESSEPEKHVYVENNSVVVLSLRGFAFYCCQRLGVHCCVKKLYDRLCSLRHIDVSLDCSPIEWSGNTIGCLRIRSLHIWDNIRQTVH